MFELPQQTLEKPQNLVRKLLNLMQVVFRLSNRIDITHFPTPILNLRSDTIGINHDHEITQSLFNI